MASAELEQVLELIASRPAPEGNPTLAEMRANMEAHSFPATDAAVVTPVDANGVPGEWVTVSESDPDRRVLYFHGGGYVFGSPLTHRRLCEDIARSGGCRRPQSRLPARSRASRSRPPSTMPSPASSSSRPTDRTALARPIQRSSPETQPAAD